MKFLSIFTRQKPQIIIATHKRKEVDCSIKNEIHQKLIKELEKAA